MNNNNNNTTTGTNSSSLDGIDIRLALEILGQRQTCTHDHTTEEGRDISVPSDIRRTWGQEIQISNDTTMKENKQQDPECSSCAVISPLDMIDTCQLTSDDNNNNNNDKSDDENKIPISNNDNNNDVLLNLDEQKNTINTIRSQRMNQIQQQLQSMSLIQVIQYILQTQQQRVQVYKDYDTGLETVLKTNNLTYYPTVVAEATANFAVLSDTINRIHTILSDMVVTCTNKETTTTAITVDDDNKEEQPQEQEHENNTIINEIIQLIKQLQLNERNKLNYTAAYHLECIRCNEQFGTISLTTSTTTIATEQKLFQQSITSLREKIQNCITNINDTIDEIKAILIDI